MPNPQATTGQAVQRGAEEAAQAQGAVDQSTQDSLDAAAKHGMTADDAAAVAAAAGSQLVKGLGHTEKVTEEQAASSTAEDTAVADTSTAGTTAATGTDGELQLDSAARTL